MQNRKCLIVISGPRCVGKSKVISDIRRNRNHPIIKTVTSNLDRLSLHSLNYIDRSPAAACENLILHYDYFRPYMRGLEGYKNDTINNLIDSYETIYIFTLFTHRMELLDRIKKRLERFSNQGICDNEKIKKLNLIQEIYMNPKEIQGYYNRWLSFCVEKTKRNFLFLNSIKGQKIICLKKNNINFDRFCR